MHLADAFIQCDLPAHLRFTFVFVLFLELRSVTLGFLALVLPTELQEILSVIYFCPHAAILRKKNGCMEN